MSAPGSKCEVRLSCSVLLFQVIAVLTTVCCGHRGDEVAQADSMVSDSRPPIADVLEARIKDAPFDKTPMDSEEAGELNVTDSSITDDHDTEIPEGDLLHPGMDGVEIATEVLADVSCLPDCSGKNCGNDGCGGPCGQCQGTHYHCMEGVCVCVPVCTGKLCGGDGCGGTCTCSGGKWCSDGVCTSGLCEVVELDHFAPGIHDIAVTNGHVYVASYRDMFVFTESPQTTESWVARSSFDYYLRDIAARDDLVVVVGESPDPLSGLTVLDVSQPAAPQVVGELALPYALNNTVDLELHDQHAFFVRLYQGLYAVSLEDPGSPTVTAVLEDVPWPKGLTISNGLAYVAGFDGLYVVDISNPADMSVVGFRHHGSECQYADIQGMRDLSVWEDTLVAIVNTGDLAVYDVSEPTTPSLLYSGEGFVEHFVQDVLMLPSSDLALIGGQLVDVSTPSSPIVVGATSAGIGYKSIVHGNELFLVGGSSVWTTHVSSVLAGQYEEVLSLPSSPSGIVAMEGTANVLDKWPQRLYGLDYAGTDLLSASFVMDVKDDEVVFERMEGAGETLYLIGDNLSCPMPATTLKVQVVEAAPDTVPIPAEGLEFPGGLEATTTNTDTLFVAYSLNETEDCFESYVSESGIYAVSLADPGKPQWLGTWSGPPAVIPSMDATEDRVFLATRKPMATGASSFGLTILDVAEPSVPIVVGMWEHEGQIGSPEVTVVGEHLILLTREKEYSSTPGVFVFDLAAQQELLPLVVDELPVSSLDTAMNHGYFARVGDAPVLSVLDIATLPLFDIGSLSEETGLPSGSRPVVKAAEGHVFIRYGSILRVFDVTGCWW